MTTSNRWSSDSSTAQNEKCSIYWRNVVNSSFLTHFDKSNVYLREWSKAHSRTIRIVVISNKLYSLLSIRAQHQTTATAHLYQQLIQRLHDTRQEQNKIFTITLYLLIMRASLSSHIFLLNKWQSLSRGTQFRHYNHEHHECKEIMIFAIEDRNIVV